MSYFVSSGRVQGNWIAASPEEAAVNFLKSELGPFGILILVKSIVGVQYFHTKTLLEEST